MLAEIPGFSAAEVGPETSLYGKGIGLSSVDVMALIIRVEEVFDVFFDDGEIVGSVETFGALVRAVRRKRASRAGPGGSDDD